MFGKKPKIEEDLEELPELDESEEQETELEELPEQEIEEPEVLKATNPLPKPEETYQVTKEYLDQIEKILIGHEERLKRIENSILKLEAFAFEMSR